MPTHKTFKAKTQRAGTLKALIAACGLALMGTSAIAQAPPAVDLSKAPTLYLIGYSHLDTEWCWSYPQVIREYLPNTLHDNFKLFEKYPDYTFNWTGSNRYQLMKEYYPADYAKLKKYVAAGRWFPAGSNVEEGDVDIPSEESVIRQILYGNQFFRREFGIASNEFMVPDCFGFPASLPSILVHCGLLGFNTQKLTWGAAIGIPFNVGVWEGTDGQSVVAALNPGAYGQGVPGDLSHDQGWIDRVNDNGKKSGVFTDFRYYGIGDRGGAPSDDDVRRMEESVHGGGPLHVLPSTTAQMFSDITPAQKAALPHYKGDILLTQHSTGSLSSEAAMKRWNRKNEILADAAERASVAADWLGAAPYDQSRLHDAWLRFLPGQFHDIMAGTALPAAYEFAWNDQLIAMNEFAGVLQESAGGVARSLDTRTLGVPLMVYNPLSCVRQDMVEAAVTFPKAAPAGVRVFGPNGKEVPAQVSSRSGNTLTVKFLGSAPPVGFAVYDVRPAATAQALNPALKVSRTGLENARYRVRLDAGGDVASIYDKLAKREMLSAPARLAYQHENPGSFPAWNMDWEDQQKAPRAYVTGAPTIKIVENGPARVALQVTRDSEGSHFAQTIRLASGSAGNRVEFATVIDWKGKKSALKAVFPLTVSNPLATYNWELGTIQRGNNDPKKYEVPAHRWFDLTDTSGKYGVSVLDDCKYGSDKPNDNTVRLTLLYTPGVRGGYQHQATQDWGRNEFTYALQGHIGDWRSGQIQWEAARLNQPLVVFQTLPHGGAQGREFSLARVSTPQVQILALKRAEDSKETVVRFNELSGLPAHAVRLTLATPIISAREINGQEQPLGPATVQNGQLVFDMDPYRPRAFALTVAPVPSRLAAPRSTPLSLPFNADVASAAAGNAGDGDFDGRGDSLPGEMLPANLVSDGTTFHLGSSAIGHKNAVICAGQHLTLTPGKNRRVSLLAAAVGVDRPATFLVDSRPVTRVIQSWDGYVGQWDNRTWRGKVPELTYDWSNKLAGLTPGYIKTASIAWYANHKRLADGTNDPYRFCYLFRYSIAVPDSAKTFTLPKDSHIRVLAASVGQDANAETIPAQPLGETLDHRTKALKPFYASFTPEIVATKIVAKIEPVYSAPAVQMFDGSKAGAQVPNITALPVGAADPWTINQFVYLDQQPAELTVIGGFGTGQDSAGTQRYLIKFHDGIHFWGSNVDVTTGVPFDLGKWQMVTLTFDGKTLTIYKDSQAIKSEAISLEDAENIVRVGAPGPWDTAKPFAGKIAGFAIWNRSLSQPEIQALGGDTPKN